jgi:hypothetical protein
MQNRTSEGYGAFYARLNSFHIPSIGLGSRSSRQRDQKYLNRKF